MHGVLRTPGVRAADPSESGPDASHSDPDSDSLAGAGTVRRPGGHGHDRDSAASHRPGPGGHAWSRVMPWHDQIMMARRSPAKLASGILEKDPDSQSDGGPRSPGGAVTRTREAAAAGAADVLRLAGPAAVDRTWLRLAVYFFNGARPGRGQGRMSQHRHPHHAPSHWSGYGSYKQGEGTV